MAAADEWGNPVSQLGYFFDGMCGVLLLLLLLLLLHVHASLVFFVPLVYQILNWKRVRTATIAAPQWVS